MTNVAFYRTQQLSPFISLILFLIATLNCKCDVINMLLLKLQLRFAWMTLCHKRPAVICQIVVEAVEMSLSSLQEFPVFKALFVFCDCTCLWSSSPSGASVRSRDTREQRERVSLGHPLCSTHLGKLYCKWEWECDLSLIKNLWIPHLPSLPAQLHCLPQKTFMTPSVSSLFRLFGQTMVSC